MPHAELKYSSDLDINPSAIFEAIETTIHEHDGASGECKCRSYPADAFRHTHCIITVSMLSKPHRDAAFTSALMADLEAQIKRCIGQPCFFSLDLSYSTGAYVTNLHKP